MILDHPAFSCEAWCLRLTGLNPEVLAQTESLFALSNGHIGWRGNLDEGEPHGLPGSYLNGVHERRTLPYVEPGYGYPESGQVIVNVTNGKVIRLLVDDEPFDLTYGTVLEHEWRLDLRDGVLHRFTDWVSPAGRRVRVSSTRLVSLVQRSIAAIRYRVEAVDRPVRVVVQSELVTNEVLPAPPPGDPRAGLTELPPVVSEHHVANDSRVGLVHSTVHSGICIAAVMGHVVDGPASTARGAESFPDLGRMTVTATLAPGERLSLDKFVAYGWSARRSRPAVWDQADAALAGARQTGWDGLRSAQRNFLDDFWATADIEIDGDPQIQQAVRFSLFHILQAAARGEGKAIPAKGLTGPGYFGHSFWDTEAFVLPVLTQVYPDAAAHALRWRHSILPLALQRSAQLGLAGAAFPWRTIHGEECSSYWPAGTNAFHINAAVADAVIRYCHTTGDDAFEREIGVELLTATARLWASLGHFDSDGRFRIDGVTGPDEYSAVADNNVYTNLMAAQNLQAAADAAERHRDRARALGVDADEIARWRAAAAAIYVPYDEQLGVHPQADGFTSHQVWDFAATGPERYPLLLHYPYFDLYRKQVVKQADLVMAMHRRTDAFTAEEKARNFGYYERLTVRDSSLSACTQAVIAAEVGHTALAYDYLGEAALMDLDDLEHNTRDGLHMASLAGSWIALVAGLAGMRDQNGSLGFAPRLPEPLTRLAFTIAMPARRLAVQVTPSTATYTLQAGDPLRLTHHGEQLDVTAGTPVSRGIPAVAATLQPPTQPPGRAPVPRGAPVPACRRPSRCT